MQEFFRTWHERTHGQEVRGTIDISKIPLIRKMNRQLLEEMDNRTFNDRFARNLAQLETLGCEIVDQSDIDITVPFRRSNSPQIVENAFESIFSESHVDVDGDQPTNPDQPLTLSHPSA
jgi:hypothetical protein